MCMCYNRSPDGALAVRFGFARVLVFFPVDRFVCTLVTTQAQNTFLVCRNISIIQCVFW